MEEHIKKVVTFIPAYNEEKTLPEIIKILRECYPQEKASARGFSIEILVVNDGSQDKTEELAKSLGVKVVSHSRNLGLGAATRTGMEKAYELGADVAIKLDADLQHRPQDIEECVRPLLLDEADLCWGSRFAGEITYKMPLYRFLGNKFFTWLMNRMTKYTITDAQTGLMAFNRRYLRVFELFGDYNPPQQLLIDANIKNMRYTEVPVVFNKREQGNSFVSFKYPFYVFGNVSRIILYADPMRVFLTIGGFFIIFSVLYTLGQKFFSFPTIFQSFHLFLLIIGVQCFFFGILADLILKKRNVVSRD